MVLCRADSFCSAERVLQRLTYLEVIPFPGHGISPECQHRERFPRSRGSGRMTA